MAELEKILCTDSRIEAAKKINAIVDAMGEGDLANIDLSNLSSAGQAKFDEKAYANEVLKKNQLTNCLLEVPQNIKLELTDGTLTLKAGSKVIVPNGFEADGTTPKFDEVTIESDISTTEFNDRTNLMALTNNGTKLFSRVLENCTSGANATTTFGYAYDTTTNKVNWYNSNGDLAGGNCSLPIAIVKAGGTSIDQVFNGFGYIGSTIWVDKGVKGLIPNGRNADGTLKNIEFTTSKVATKTIESTYSGNMVCVLDKTDYISRAARQDYSYDANLNESFWYGKSSAIVKFVDFTATNGVISNFQPKLPVRLLTYDDVKINNPYFFGQYIWSEFAPDNLSWLKSSGQWNSGSGYQAFYDWALANANANKSGFKLSTASYTDYDFVVNTSAKTFRLPVKVQNTPPNNTASVVGNGKALGFTTNKSNYVVLRKFESSDGNHINYPEAVSNVLNIGDTVGGDASARDSKAYGISLDPTKSGLVANLSANTNVSLYFYVGETVKDPTLINMAQIASNFADKLDRGNKVEITNWCTPDYTAKISITAPFTAPKAGIVIIDHAWSKAGWQTFVNGNVFITQNNASSYGQQSAGTILVGAGDVITTNATWESAVFVPMKGVK